MGSVQAQSIETAIPVLSVEGLTTSFLVDGAWKPVVRDVSFTVAPGETVAIVGESGSGKSVTSLSIMRLLQAEVSRIEGRVMLGGRDLLALPEQAMRQVRGYEVAMIFPGADDVAQSALHHRRSDFRSAALPFPISAGPMPRPKRSGSWKRFASPRPPRASTNIRIVFPAACGSG